MQSELRSLVRLLGQCVELGNGVVECLLGEVASSVWAVEDLVAARRQFEPSTEASLEDGEVEGESETDGVRRGQLGNGNVGCSLVGFERLVGRVLPLVASGKLGEISVVVAHPASKRQQVIL